MRGSGRALMDIEADSGLSMFDSFAKYDHDASVWRTHQACLDGGLTECLGTWPRAGMTRNGTAFLRRPLVPSITVTACSSGRIPTPTACDHKGSGRPRKGRGPGNNLRDWFRQTYGLLYPPADLVEWMLGFPIGFTDLKRSGTRSSRKSPK